MIQHCKEHSLNKKHSLNILYLDLDNDIQTIILLTFIFKSSDDILSLMK